MGKRIIGYIIVALCLFSSCDKESGPLILDETDKEYNYYDCYTDEYGNKGIVVHITKNSDSPTGRRSIIVLSTDETCCPWGPMGENVGGQDTASYVLSEKSYSLMVYQNMKARGIERYPAQAWCDLKNGAGSTPYSGSWRLPSYDEFKHIFTRVSINLLNTALRKNGGTPIDDDTKYYWTCTEDVENYITIIGATGLNYEAENRAVISTIKNSTSGNKDKWMKKNWYNVRAIKYIYCYDY